MPEKPLNVIQNDIDNVLKESETHRRALGGGGGKGEEKRNYQHNSRMEEKIVRHDTCSK
jgi:hypothetical protein